MPKKLSLQDQKTLIITLQKRFEKNRARHQELMWPDVQAKLEACPEKLWSLNEMELSGGAPDVAGYNKVSDEYIFYDCADESPKGRRSLCYDKEALESRKTHKPQNSATEVAGRMGIDLMTEAQYRHLQTLGNFDTKTSSWIWTPPEIRQLGGAIFCDFRYGHIFVYHNGAESYYAARGFRGVLKI